MSDDNCGSLGVIKKVNKNDCINNCCPNDETSPELMEIYNDPHYQPTISTFTDFRLLSKASYDVKLARYHGLPSEMEQFGPNKQFGVSLDLLPKVKHDPYPMRLPGVLIMIVESLNKIHGFETEGIFRVEGDYKLTKTLIESINNGKYEDCDDPLVLSTLFKYFFIELPEGLMDEISHEEAVKFIKKEKPNIQQFLLKLPNEKRNLLFYVLDICLSTLFYQKQNQMSEKALGIVFGSVLFHHHIKTDDPMIYAQKMKDYNNTIEKLISWRESNSKEFF